MSIKKITILIILGLLSKQILSQQPPTLQPIILPTFPSQPTDALSFNFQTFKQQYLALEPTKINNINDQGQNTQVPVIYSAYSPATATVYTSYEQNNPLIMTDMLRSVRVGQNNDLNGTTKIIDGGYLGKQSGTGKKQSKIKNTRSFNIRLNKEEKNVKRQGKAQAKGKK